MSEDEDKGELKERDYLEEVADWMDRMPCDWKVCQEVLGDAIGKVSAWQADEKVIFVSLMALANLTAAQINENEKGVDFEELLKMAKAMSDDIILKEEMKANVAKKQAEVLGALVGRGFPPFAGRGYL